MQVHGFIAGLRTGSAKRHCGVLLLWDRLSAELSSGRSTYFAVTIPVTNRPLGAVQIGRDTQR